MAGRDDEKMQKHSVVIAGHSTSVTLENIFWRELKACAKAEDIALSALITRIDQTRETNLSSAIRVYVLKARMGTKPPKL